MKQHSFRT